MKNLDIPARPVDVELYHSEGGHSCDSFGLTKREQACISLLIPESGDSELDELIRKSRRQKLAGDILNGMLSSEAPEWIGAHDTNAESAIKQAYELIKQLESE